MFLKRLRTAGLRNLAQSLLWGSLGAMPFGPVFAEAEAPVLNFYNWADYVGANTVSSFQRATGIKVNYDVFDSEETLQSKLVIGKAVYDVVVPSAAYIGNQIQAGVYQKLDKRLIPNWSHLDATLMAKLAEIDPGNQYAVPWAWGTDGLGVNVTKVRELLGPQAPLDSLALLFDPAHVARLSACGVTVLDSGGDLFRMALVYLHRDGHQPDEADLHAAFELLKRIRPFITQINSNSIRSDLVNGQSCLALGWSGDLSQAVQMAQAAHRPFELRYVIPREGSVVWFDVMAIPKGAPHPLAAHRWINHVLQADVSADISNRILYPTGVLPPSLLVRPEIRNNRALYLTHAEIERLGVPSMGSFELTRQLNRLWTSFKANL